VAIPGLLYDTGEEDLNQRKQPLLNYTGKILSPEPRARQTNKNDGKSVVLQPHFNHDEQ
jgi:hypothetical protein